MVNVDEVGGHHDEGRPFEILPKEKLGHRHGHEVRKDYHTISTVFSSAEHMTVEKYFILQKVERAKELLLDSDLSFSQIARKLAYSSSAHFSNQFKQITGQPLTEYKKNSSSVRKFIDQVK